MLDTDLLIQIRDGVAGVAERSSSLAAEQAAAKVRAENIAYQVQQIEGRYRGWNRRLREVEERLRTLEQSPPVARCEHDGAVVALTADLARLKALPWWRRALGLWVALIGLWGAR